MPLELQLLLALAHAICKGTRLAVVLGPHLSTDSSCMAAQSC